MSAPFDPYLQWLGIEGEGIPSHYELFGLRAKESDRTVVEKATNARLARLKAIDPGEHREVWEQLVAYLEEGPGRPARSVRESGIRRDAPRVPACSSRQAVKTGPQIERNARRIRPAGRLTCRPTWNAKRTNARTASIRSTGGGTGFSTRRPACRNPGKCSRHTRDGASGRDSCHTRPTRYGKLR